MRDRVFRDPVHGLIEFKGEDRALATVLETRPVQRLRRVHQMGFAWLVYPGAEHSRFGHGLGAYHIASRIVRRLELAPNVARHVELAALLHDVGHGPFSHTWEQAFPGLDHEAWGARIVQEAPDLAAALTALEPELPQTLARFWDKTYHPAFARKLVSSQLDVDRLDYLLRDGHYSGAGYATFDLDWIIHALQLAPVRGDATDPDLVVDYRRGMFAVEQYLFARSYMYAQVYHHKTVRAAEWMFLKLLRRFTELALQDAEPPGLPAAGRLARGDRLSVPEYLSLDDAAVFTALDGWAGCSPTARDAEDPVLRDLSARLVDRRLFKTIDLGDDPSVIERVEGEALAHAEKRFGAAARYYYQLDHTRQVGYRAEADEELHVVGHPRYGTATLGRLFEDLPLGRTTSTVRLVCAQELVDDLLPLAEAALARVRGRR